MNTKKQHIHFVGIGGIGMSAIATILRKQGFFISGCDINTQQQTIKKLTSLGCKIYHGNNTAQCKRNDIDIVVYSSIIKPNDDEIRYAQQRGIPVIPRALMLAELMQTKTSIAISGSHGKTTTTSLLAHIFMHTRRDPTVLIGGHLTSIAHNAHYGNGDILIAEADESDRSLLYLKATDALVTNIDFEHPETYNSIDDVYNVFQQFINNLPFYGTAFINTDDQHARNLSLLSHRKIVSFGTNKQAAIQTINTQLYDTFSIFTVLDTIRKQSFDCTLSIAGKHNISNALGAIAVSLDKNITPHEICTALRTFTGVQRRFSYHGKWHGAFVYDDYGHHPTEISCTLSMARKCTKGKLIVVFPPHKFSRTKHLWDSFVSTFAHNHSIDTLILTDIYPANETPIERISSQRLVETIKKQNNQCNVHYHKTTNDHKTLINALKKEVSFNDLVLFLGAGPLYKLAEQLTSKR